MLMINWLTTIAKRHQEKRRLRHSRRRSTRLHRQLAVDHRVLTAQSVEMLENRILLASDFGDAPDTGVGTGSGNYNTVATDNGPSHTIVAGLFLGAIVDGDNGTLQNTAANADDVDGALPDDEDGLNNPAADLNLTVGAAPTVNAIVTNNTGIAATLFGWIDTNNDGLFDNTTERASIAVPTGTTVGTFTLTFPAVTGGFTGTTYARFRLSTDAAAANPTGAAGDGEVEDYRATIVAPSSGFVDSSTKITDGTNGGPALAGVDRFGSSVTAVGDLDGDGVSDMAVGAYGDDTGGNAYGAVYVLFMNTNGTVKSSTKIASGTGGGPALGNGHFFGRSVTALGDLDGDGVTDLAVGADGVDIGGSNSGSVHVLFMNTNGTVESSTRIASNTNGGPILAGLDYFGSSVTAVGDLDGDGVTDLAVGARGDGTGGDRRGAVHVLFMNTDGTAKSSTKIADSTGGGPALTDLDRFGNSVATLGDLDGDGVSDLAVGAYADDTGGNARGAVHVLLLNVDGTVKSSTKIASGTGGGPILADGVLFGRSVTAVGDLDGDGVTDLAVGADRDHTGGSYRGAVHVLLLNIDGTVNSSTKVASGTGGGPMLADSDFFGRSVTSLGDLDGDGVTDLAVGADLDDTGGLNRGAVHVLFLKPSSLIASADFDANGDVDGSDFLAWQRGFGILSPNATKPNGDADNDLDVDGNDLAIWKNQFGQGVGLLAANSTSNQSAPAQAAINPASPTIESITSWELTDAVMALELPDAVIGGDEVVAVEEQLLVETFFEPMFAPNDLALPSSLSSFSASRTASSVESDEAIIEWFGDDAVDEVFERVFA
jgi:hypothetical protein